MEVCLLGPVEVRWNGKRLDLGHARQRCVFAVLVEEPGRLISVHELIDRVWGGAPPDGVRQTLQAYVSRLRGVIGAPLGRRVLRHQRGGYLIDIDAETIDVHQFRWLVSRARRSVETADDRAAQILFDRALQLWRGEALSDLEGHWADGMRVRLSEEWFTAVADRVDTRLRLGGHAEVIAELAALVHRYPRRERTVGQFMVALYRCGRQSDALDVYRTVRRRLVEEGLVPGPGLRRVEERILRVDPTLDDPLRPPYHTDLCRLSSGFSGDHDRPQP